MLKRIALVPLSICGMAGFAFGEKLPSAYFRLMESGAAEVEQALDASPGANLATLEARPGWKHFPYAILAPAVLYAKRHPDNPHYHDPRMLTLAIRIGDLLAQEDERGAYEPRLDSDWDTYMWLEAYRLLEQELGEERGASWRRHILRNAAVVHDDAAVEQTQDGYWGEHSREGPTTGYDHITMTQVALYYEYTKDRQLSRRCGAQPTSIRISLISMARPS